MLSSRRSLLRKKNLGAPEQQRIRLTPDFRKNILEQAIELKAKDVSFEDFAASMSIAPRSLYYWQKQANAPPTEAKQKSPPANKLKSEERKEIVNALLRPTWVDISPREIYYRLLDEEQRLIASVSSFYRVARDKNLLTTRTKTSTGTKLNRETPHLVATGSNQVWSWDVTQIETLNRLNRLYLYVIIDIWNLARAGFTPLEAAQLLKDNEAIRQIKDEEAMRFTAKGKALMNAVKKNDFKSVKKYLADLTTPIEETDKDGFTPLLWAAREGMEKVVTLLLAHGANPNHRDWWMGANAGHKAGYWGRTDVMKILVQNKLDINVRGLANGSTPLHDAVSGNRKGFGGCRCQA